MGIPSSTVIVTGGIYAKAVIAPAMQKIPDIITAKNFLCFCSLLISKILLLKIILRLLDANPVPNPLSLKILFAEDISKSKYSY